MKKTWNIFIALLCSILSFSACSEKEDAIVGLSVDKTEVTLGEDGGSEELHITSDQEWVSSASQPWLRLSPANGVGSTECTIVVDSSLVSNIREANIVINTPTGAGKVIKVIQTGYDKVISVSTQEVKVESSGKFGERYFDVSITTNVLFDISIDKEWVSYDQKQLDINLDRGDRPRTLKFRFNWNMNVNPEERVADVLFKAKEAQYDVKTIMTVTQEAAPLIEDNRAGDSLALVMINERIETFTQYDTSERIDTWSGVTVWEKGDKWKDTVIPEEMVGRVRSASFYMFKTKESVPNEVSKLKYAEFISFYGNANIQLLDIELGDVFSDLKWLRSLQVEAYGLSSIPASLTKLTQLEELYLGINNFSKVPDILTPANFPNLRKLSLSTCRRLSFTDLGSNDPIGNGLYLSISKNTDDMNQLKRLLSWEKLESLAIGVNYLEGELPDMLNDGLPTYTMEEVLANDTLATAKDWLVGQPKVLPNARELRLNLNMFTGKIPDWILYHPYLLYFDPFTLIYNQEGFNSDNVKAGFDNVPASWDYYYDLYPLRKPTN